MTIQSEVEIKQVRLIQGTGSQIDKAKASGEILDTDLVVQTDAPELQEKIDDLDSIRKNAEKVPTVEAIAKGAQSATSFINYQSMVTNLNAYEYDKFAVGQSIYIGTKDVPDVWIYAKYQEAQPYTYTTDDAIVDALKTGTLRIGRFEISALETVKVDIDGVIKGVQVNGTDLTPNTDKKVNIPSATNTSYGVVKASQSFGTYMSNGIMCTWKATAAEVVAKTQNYRPIVPSLVDKAVMEGLGNNSLTWTEAYKESARNTIGAEAQATIQTLQATDSITLADNTIYNGGEQTALTIALPATVDVSFLCEICFSSPETATTLSYPQSDINWAGDDTSGGLFIPVSGKRYTIICAYNGTSYNFVVKGV